MKFQILTEEPAWWILVCVLAGTGAAFLLYRNDRTFGTRPWLKRLLFLLRALSLSLISYLLLTPLIRTFSRETEKPLLIIALDNSQSILLNKDSAYLKKEFPEKIASLGMNLQGKYDVKTLYFGDRVEEKSTFSFDEKQTDFSFLLKDIDTRYSNRNVGAIIVASDGIYNRGSNPVYSSTDLNVPVYTIALGDTLVRKDLLISRVNYNKIVYLGNTFPLEISADARQCNGEQTTLTVMQDSAILFSRTLVINGGKFNQVVPVILEAKKKGIQHYTIRLSSLTGEMTLANNVKDVFVEVLDSKQKILIVADAPHPDLGALKLTIESNQNYEVKSVLADKMSENINDYNLLILHNLPSIRHQVSDLLNNAVKKDMPVLFILGPQTNMNAFNLLDAGLRVNVSSVNSNLVQAAINQGFSLFTISDELRHFIPQLPPLLTQFGTYRSMQGNTTLLYQQIGNVATEQPLLTFNESNRARTGVLCGEGFWKWRLNDYLVNGNFNTTNELITKTIQFLSTRENRSHFRLVLKNNFAENEPVTIDAEVYNDNYELVNTPDINITITDVGKKSYPYVFSRTDRAYTLNAGFFPPGDYKYRASVRVGDKPYTHEGSFSVQALQVELSESIADHQMLYAWAAKHGGKMYYPQQLDELSKSLLSREDIKTLSYSHYKLQDLINLKSIFALLLIMLSLEWFLRKRAGGY